MVKCDEGYETHLTIYSGSGVKADDVQNDCHESSYTCKAVYLWNDAD